MNVSDREFAAIDSAVMEGSLQLGTHLVQYHSGKHAFVVTAFNRPQPSYRQHLVALLHHVSSLQGIQWINFNRSSLELITIVPEPFS
jgi:hypothetical protein